MPHSRTNIMRFQKAATGLITTEEFGHPPETFRKLGRAGMESSARRVNAGTAKTRPI